MWPQHKMFSALARKLTACWGYGAQPIPLFSAGGSILEHQSQARGHCVIPSATAGQICPGCSSFSEENPRENTLFFVLWWNFRDLRTLGRICFVSQKKKKKIWWQKNKLYNKNSRMVFLVYSSLELFGVEPNQDAYGWFFWFWILSLSVWKPKQAQPWAWKCGFSAHPRLPMPGNSVIA